MEPLQRQRNINDMFRLCKTETDKIWLTQNCVEVITLHRVRYRHKFQFSRDIFCVSLLVSVSVAGSLNALSRVTNGTTTLVTKQILTDRYQRGL